MKAKVQDRKMRACSRRILSIAVLGLIFAFLVSPSFLLSKSENPLKRKVDPVIKIVAGKHNVPPELIHSVIKAESNYNTEAVSPKGAIGIMQLMPETAKTYDVKDIYSVAENIEGGVRYLKDLIKLYGGKTDKVLAAYNAGQEAVKKYQGIPPYPETQAYIRKVMASYPRAYIPSGSKINKFVDSSGNVVFTNDPYYLLNKSRGSQEDEK